MTVYYRPSYKKISENGSEQEEKTPYYMYTPTADGKHYSRTIIEDKDDLPRPLRNKTFEEEAGPDFIVSVSCCVKKHTADVNYAAKASTPLTDPLSDTPLLGSNQTFNITNIRPFISSSNNRSRTRSVGATVSFNTASATKGNIRARAYSGGGTLLEPPKLKY